MLKNLRKLNHYLIRYKWRLLLGVLFVALSNYFKALVPQSIRDALNFSLEQIEGYKLNPSEAAMSEISGSLLKYALVVIGLTIMMGIFMYFMRQTVIVVSRLIEYDLRKDIYDHYQKMDLAFFKRNKTGDLMARITEDVTKVRMYLGPAILYGINLSTLFVVVIYAMIKVSPSLTLWTLLPLPFLSLSIYLVSSVIHKRSEQIQIQLSKLNSIAQEIFSGIRVIKSYSKEEEFQSYFDQECQHYKDKSMSLAKVNALFFPLMILLISLSTLLTIYMGGVYVSRGLISPGNVAEFVIYVNYLTWPFTAVGWIASIIQQAEASQKRINEFLEEEPLITSPTIEKKGLKGNIKFENVTFTYPDSGQIALKNVSFELKSGEKMAILGKTASGKTTIADLVLRMYDIDSGRISIDGVDIKQHDLYNLRQKIGYVPQDVFLFSDSIEDNIRFVNEKINADDVKKYAGFASIDKDIEGLPEAYQTMVGERGVTLSGGQKQRISIARAFIQNPDIILLDDCLSAVDTDTEQRILGYLSEMIEDKTAVIITHRIHSHIAYDKIIILNDGRIVEEGSHAELMGLNGEYAEMYHRQHLQEES